MSASQHMRRFGQAVGYYPALTKIFGSVSASILFAQLFYWQPKATSPLGVYKTAEELTEETGLSVDEQRGARKKLVKLGVLVETHKRLEHKIYYRIDEDAFDALWDITQTENDTNGETEYPTGETDIPTPEVGNSQPPNGKFPFGESEIPIRHSNTEDYGRGLRQGITANAPARDPDPREPSPPPPAKPERFDAWVVLSDMGVERKHFDAWMQARKRKRLSSPIDEVALAAFFREIGKVGLTAHDAARMCAERGWGSIEANWDCFKQRTSQRGNTFEHQGSAEQYAQEQAERMRPQIAAMFAAKQEKRDD